MGKRCSDCRVGVVVETVKHCGGHAFPPCVVVTSQIRAAYEASMGAWHSGECYEAMRPGGIECRCGLDATRVLLRTILERCDEDRPTAAGRRLFKGDTDETKP